MHWCDSPTRIDTEACLSYLRGVFDTLQLTRPAPAGAAGANPPAICIPPEAAITELRRIARAYGHSHPEALAHRQAADVVLGALRAVFPCPPASPLHGDSNKATRSPGR